MASSVVGVLLLSLAFVAGKTPTKNCERNWEKVGCFHDDIVGANGRVYPYELVNYRDPTNPNWDGNLIDWNKYNQSIHALACSCAEKAKAMNYQFFALQFYGECWSGPTPQFSRDGTSKKCIGTDYKPCDVSAETECIGGASTNFVYRVVEPKKEAEINGVWTDWSSWTACSKSCMGGKRLRHRTCTNPAPANGGSECEGDEAEHQTCNEESCEPVCDKPLEMAIVLDASTSVTRKNWDETLEFVQKFTDNGFTLGEKKVRIGIIQFSWFPTLQFKLTDKRYWNAAAFKKRVSTIRYTYGGTRTDLAIKMADEKLLCNTCHVRPKVPRTLLVLTDGKSSMASAPMSQVTQQLKENGVTIISVGVGMGIDPDELAEIATDENHVVMLTGYTYLDDPINKLVKLTCGRK